MEFLIGCNPRRFRFKNCGMLSIDGDGGGLGCSPCPFLKPAIRGGSQLMESGGGPGSTIEAP